jgi:hypothetical protein
MLAPALESRHLNPGETRRCGDARAHSGHLAQPEHGLADGRPSLLSLLIQVGGVRGALVLGGLVIGGAVTAGGLLRGCRPVPAAARAGGPLQRGLRRAPIPAVHHNSD